ncbi:reactive intermediate/imine deaminase [Paenibacillus sp. J31TS4]|uniref:RidA family protein n=1 Tax=Paenibacillus sp. J31TS4 TaxID=2807195 RepID=UPI001B101991|nr:RidA family protein [Paenibacillus sp. J31TS4]GIP37582.1 reactive intermediate/imine deaminase [Paenibacillus sp. J31TS4]
MNAEQAAKAVSPALPFSMAVQSGPYVFVSGQGGIDPDTGKPAGDSLEEQTALTMENVRRVLAMARLELKDIVKVTAYLSDPDDYPAFNALYRTYFPEGYPARTLVYCSLNYDLRVELDVIAAIGPDAGTRIYYPKEEPRP